MSVVGIRDEQNLAVLSDEFVTSMGNLDRGTDQLRVYCKLVEGIPRRDETYNLLFLFYVDKHKYRERKLDDMDEAAKRQIERIEAYRSLDAVDDYLDRRQALDEDDLTRLIEDGNDAFS